MAPLRFYGYYEAYWSGLPVAGMVLAIEETEDRYRIQTYIEGQGVLRLVRRFESKALSEGHRNHINWQPVHYESWHRWRHKTKRFTIDYDEEGRIAGQNYDPPFDPNKREPVPDELKNYTLDPLTALLSVREEAGQPTESLFSLRVYDGRRRSDLHFLIEEKRPDELDSGEEITVIPLRFIMDPLAGLTTEEREDAEEYKPELTMLVRDDARRIPVRIEAEVSIGTAIALFREECMTLTSCLRHLD